MDRGGFDTLDAASALLKLGSIDRVSARMIELPSQMAGAFVAVACELASSLPPGSLSDTEMTLFFNGSGRQVDRDFQPARRKSIETIAWLPSREIGNRRFLDLSCLSKTAQRSTSSLVQTLLGVAPSRDRAIPPEGGPSARVLAKAMARTLLRAYAQGLRVVVSRYVPRLFDNPGTRPATSDPWILVRSREEQVHEVTWYWLRTDQLPD